VVYPAWLKLMKDRIPQRIQEFGKAVFNTSTAEETISALENFFISIEAPVRMNELGIGKDKKPEILDMMIKNKVNGMYYMLTNQDLEKILDFMFYG
ncbi:MAG: iron-containing alcohol dehydrogenase, partial [Bacteroidales bacterium]|nr:iron-containing alcohol dehydrogenase [Bacteroidales bacterium]